MKALLLLLPLLAACSAFGPTKSEPGTPQRQCEDAADADPKIHNFWSTTPSSLGTDAFQDAYKAARDASIRQCLRARSGFKSTGGGVEKPIR